MVCLSGLSGHFRLFLTWLLHVQQRHSPDSTGQSLAHRYNCMPYHAIATYDAVQDVLNTMEAANGPFFWMSAVHVGPSLVICPRCRGSTPPVQDFTYTLPNPVTFPMQMLAKVTEVTLCCGQDGIGWQDNSEQEPVQYVRLKAEKVYQTDTVQLNRADHGRSWKI